MEKVAFADMVPGCQYHHRNWGEFLALAGNETSRRIWNRDGFHQLRQSEYRPWTVEATGNQDLTDLMMNRLRRDLDFHSLDVKCGVHLGSDPEIFVRHGDGSVFPAWEFLEKKPKITVHKNQWGETVYEQHVFWDGVQAEFTTSPYQCLAYLVDNIRDGLDKLWRMARQHDRGASLWPINAVEVPEIVASASEEHIQFGCMPSKNAYGIRGKLAHYRDLDWRFAGCHIHFGTDRIHPSMVVECVKALDAIAGVGLVSLVGERDLQVRRQYYGCVGEYRTPKHGLEWRVPSAWILCHPVVTHLAFDLARVAFGIGVNGVRGVWRASEEEVVECVQKGDVGLARRILTRNKRVLSALMDRIYGDRVADEATSVWMSGADSLGVDLEDMEASWRLGTNEWVYHSDGENECFRAWADPGRAY